MADYHSFTTTRPTPPNALSLIAAVRLVVDASVGIADQQASWLMKKATTWTAADISAAQTALDTCAADTLQLQAQQKVDSMDIFDRALVLVELDQFNLVRAKLRGLGVTGIPDITIPQMMQAIRDKAGTL